MGNEVLYYIPNIIGYVRLALLVASLIVYKSPPVFLVLYGVSVVLDGIIILLLEYTVLYGSVLMPAERSVFDVLIDLISRGALWCFISKWGYFVMMIEWLTFVCTHSRGSNWKIPDEEFPAICKMVMAKGFKTPVGAYAITGIFVLPLWIYGMTSGFLVDYVGLPSSAQYSLLVLFIGGRILALTTELFFIQQHIKGLLAEGNTSKTSTPS